MLHTPCRCLSGAHSSWCVLRSRAIFNDPSLDDLGIYSCVVTNTDGVSASYTLTEEGESLSPTLWLTAVKFYLLSSGQKDPWSFPEAGASCLLLNRNKSRACMHVHQRLDKAARSNLKEDQFQEFSIQLRQSCRIQYTGMWWNFFVLFCLIFDRSEALVGNQPWPQVPQWVHYSNVLIKVGA